MTLLHYGIARWDPGPGRHSEALKPAAQDQSPVRAVRLWLSPLSPPSPRVRCTDKEPLQQRRECFMEKHLQWCSGFFADTWIYIGLKTQLISPSPTTSPVKLKTKGISRKPRWNAEHIHPRRAALSSPLTAALWSSGTVCSRGFVYKCWFALPWKSARILRELIYKETFEEMYMLTKILMSLTLCFKCFSENRDKYSNKRSLRIRCGQN